MSYAANRYKGSRNARRAGRRPGRDSLPSREQIPQQHMGFARENRRRQNDEAIVNRARGSIKRFVEVRWNRFIRAGGFKEAVHSLFQRLGRNHKKKYIWRAFQQLLDGGIFREEPGGYRLVAH